MTNVTLTIPALTNGSTDVHTETVALYSVVTVTGIPNSGFELAYWVLDGHCKGKSTSYTVNMGSDHALYAVFDPIHDNSA